jgi:hypothetical protein
MAIAGRKAIVKVTGAALALTNEPCTDVLGDGSLIQITNAAKRVLDRAAVWSLFRDGGLWVSFGAHGALDLINRLNGSVTLGSTPGGAGHTWLLTGTYLPTASVIEGKSWMYELSSGNLTKPQFLDIWQTRLMGIRDAKGKIGLWRTTDETLVNLVLTGAPVVVDFYDDASLPSDLRMWAQPSKASLDALVNNLVNHDFDFDSTPDVDGRTATNVP